MQNEVTTLFVIVASAFFAILMVAFITIFLLVTQKRSFRYNENLETIKKEYDSAILNSQLEVQTNTLQQVSEELHDNIGQLLSSVIMFVKVLGAKAQPELQPTVEDTRLLVQEVKDQLRHISRSISSKQIEDFGLFEAINYQTTWINKSGAIKVEIISEGIIKKFNPSIELVLFRMVQELLNNAMKHSECENITISLNYMADKIIITVKDDGRGFDKNETEKNKQFKDGSGLHSLENKARNIKCSIAFNSGRKGTMVTLIKDFQNDN